MPSDQRLNGAGPAAENCPIVDFTGGILDFIDAHLGARCRVSVGHLSDGSGLPTAREVGDLLRHPLVRAQVVRVVTGGVTQPVEHFSTGANYNSKVVKDSLDSRALRRAFLGGSTLIIEDVGRWHPRVSTICNTIFNEQWLYANAGYFMTTTANCGLPFHADEEITFVFQLAGSKQWHVAEHGVDRLGVAEVAPEQRVVEFTMRPGDAACIPPMYPHRTRTVDEGDSLHLTIGVRPFKVKDLLRDLVERGVSRVPSLDREIPSVGSIAETLTDAVADAPVDVWQRELAISSIRVASGMADRGFEFDPSSGDDRGDPGLGDLVWKVRLGRQYLVYLSGAFALIGEGALEALERAMADREHRGRLWRELMAGDGLPAPVRQLLESAGWARPGSLP